LDIESAEPEIHQLIESLAGETSNLPLVLFSDGTRLATPSNTEVAGKIGLRMRAEMPFLRSRDCRRRPCGSGRGSLRRVRRAETIIVEREAPGGQAGQSSRIENYLGFPSGLTAADLARRAVTQARRFGVEILAPQEAVGLRLDGPYRVLKLADHSELSCHALLIATGVQCAVSTCREWSVCRAQGCIWRGPAEAISCKDEDVYIGAARIPPARLPCISQVRTSRYHARPW